MKPPGRQEPLPPRVVMSLEFSEAQQYLAPKMKMLQQLQRARQAAARAAFWTRAKSEFRQSSDSRNQPSATVHGSSLGYAQIFRC